MIEQDNLEIVLNEAGDALKSPSRLRCYICSKRDDRNDLSLSWHQLINYSGEEENNFIICGDCLEECQAIIRHEEIDAIDLEQTRLSLLGKI